jgi:hypothetical protein
MMGMTDRQFDSYQAGLLARLKLALKLSPNDAKLKELIEELVKELEAELKRP